MNGGCGREDLAGRIAGCGHFCRYESIRIDVYVGTTVYAFCGDRNQKFL